MIKVYLNLINISLALRLTKLEKLIIILDINIFQGFFLFKISLPSISLLPILLSLISSLQSILISILHFLGFTNLLLFKIFNIKISGAAFQLNF